MFEMAPLIVTHDRNAPAYSVTIEGLIEKCASQLQDWVNCIQIKSGSRIFEAS
jgi:hypothetical protein